MPKWHSEVEKGDGCEGKVEDSDNEEEEESDEDEEEMEEDEEDEKRDPSMEGPSLSQDNSSGEPPEKTSSHVSLTLF